MYTMGSPSLGKTCTFFLIKWGGLGVAEKKKQSYGNQHWESYDNPSILEHFGTLFSDKHTPINCSAAVPYDFWGMKAILV